MPDDQNTPKNPTPEETTPKDGQNSSPTSPQEPTEPIPVNSTDLGDSHPSVPVEELGAEGGDLKGVGYDNIPPPEGSEGENAPLSAEKPFAEAQDLRPKETPEAEKTQENQASSGAEALTDKENKPEIEPVSEPISKPAEAPEVETPQIPVNEALPESEPSTSPPPQSTSEASETKEEPKPVETPEPEPAKETPEPEPSTSAKVTTDKEKEKPLDSARDKPFDKTQDKPRISYLKSQKWSELLVMARNAIQFRKRRKLDRVMTLFLKQSKITNDEVEKHLHVSDATASRYLSQLEKEGRIKQHGRTGAGVSYSRI